MDSEYMADMAGASNTYISLYPPQVILFPQLFHRSFRPGLSVITFGLAIIVYIFHQHIFTTDPWFLANH